MGDGEGERSSRMNGVKVSFVCVAPLSPPLPGPSVLVYVELIIVVVAAQQRALEPRADLESFGGRQGHACLGKVGL